LVSATEGYTKPMTHIEQPREQARVLRALAREQALRQGREPPVEARGAGPPQLVQDDTCAVR
jgi:hypothetical protein